MYRVQQKELMLRKFIQGQLEKIWPNLSSWTWLQSPDLRFKDFITSFFFFKLWLTEFSEEILIKMIFEAWKVDFWTTIM